MELIALILIRLPVKLLLLFKTVSKEWCSLISGQYFIELRNNHFPAGGHKDDEYLITVSCAAKDRCSLQRRAIDTCLTIIKESDMPPVSKNKVQYYRGLDVCGSCNGWVLIRVAYATYYEKIKMIMWNPLSNNYFVLPFIDLDEIGYNINDNYFGFGYDQSNNDYKVVSLSYIKIDRYTRDYGPYSRQVYSSKKNCWGASLIEDNGCVRYMYQDNALINNHIIHWFFRDSKDRHLRGFDLCSEEWLDDVPLPDSPPLPGRGDTLQLHLGVLDNCLCVGGFSCGQPFHITLLWVMKEYGVKESWTKLLVLDDLPNNNDECLLDPPLTYSIKGDEVLFRMEAYGGTEHLIWYDFKSKTMTYADPRRWGGDKVIHCVASLIRAPNIDGCVIQEYRKTTNDDKRNMDLIKDN